MFIWPSSTATDKGVTPEMDLECIFTPELNAFLQLKYLH